MTAGTRVKFTDIDTAEDEGGVAGGGAVSRRCRGRVLVGGVVGGVVRRCWSRRCGGRCGRTAWSGARSGMSTCSSAATSGGAADDDVLGDADGSVVAELTAGPTDAGAGCRRRLSDRLLQLDGRLPRERVHARTPSRRPPRRCRRGSAPVPAASSGAAAAAGPSQTAWAGEWPEDTPPSAASAARCRRWRSARRRGIRPVARAGAAARPRRAAGGAYAEAVPASAGSDPATHRAPRPDAAATGPDQAKPGRDGVPWANVRVSESGSQFPPGCSAPTSASRPLAVGRCRGSLARQCSISGRTVGGTRSRLGARAPRGTAAPPSSRYRTVPHQSPRTPARHPG